MLLNLCTAVFDANCKSVSFTSSPFIVPNDPPKTDVKEDVPKKTKGSAQAAITINSLGPVKKFLSDSIIVVTL